MKRKIVTAGAIVSFLLAGLTATNAQTLDAILKVKEGIHTLAQASQQRIDQISNETSGLLADYRDVLKQIETLQAYNAQIERLISSQNAEIASLNNQIDNVTVIDRQIAPLMGRMIESLAEFVRLDVPFLVEERADRIETLRDMMDRADVANSEKFRRLLEAYQIESAYGRELEVYGGELEKDGVSRLVDFLRIGRVLLFYQTRDRVETGVWDQSARNWAVLDNEYRNPVLDAIQVAQKRKSPDTLLRLPIPAPENAQ